LPPRNHPGEPPQGDGSEIVTPARIGAPPAPSPDDVEPRHGHARRDAWLRRLTWLGALLLLLAAGGVFFLLPGAVEREAPEPATPVSEEAELTVEPAAPQPAGASRDAAAELAAAERALGELVARRAQLEAVGAPEWAGEDWAEIQAESDRGDAALRAERAAEAAAAYRSARVLLDALAQQSALLVEESLAGGEAALERGDAADALARFSLAKRIDAENARAARGLERSERIEEVFALLRAGEQLEQAGDFESALERYTDAKALDPELARSEQAIARAREAVEQAGYLAAMSEAHAALAAGRNRQAELAFRAALRTRPDSAAAREGMAQAQDRLALEKIALHRESAMEFESAEEWAQAAAEYRSALAVDPTLRFAQRGADRSERRARLSEQLDALSESPERLATQEARDSAVALLRAAVAIPQPGPRLEQQIDALALAVDRASSEVRVALESDGLTNVVLYRVGRLGRFRSQEVSLLPGTYTVVGTRDGFRDVRRVFTVKAGERPTPVVVRCEEPL